MSGDQYTDADTGVFYNKLGLRSRAELDAAERDITRIRETELAAHPLRATYDLEHLRAVHAHLFSDIYTWAGELRTVSIAKTDLFCLPQYIESQAQQVFRKLAANDCLRDLPPEKFIEGLAHLLGEINAIHPFRDGNGRAQRAIVSQLALDAATDWIGPTLSRVKTSSHQ